MKSILFYFNLLLLLFVSQISYADEFERIPSSDLRKIVNEEASELFVNLKKSPKKRIALLSNVWSLSTRSHKVDNRAYLMTLAIDLYNSLPPDLLPKVKNRGPDEDVYIPNTWPLKEQISNKLVIFKNPARPLEEEIGNWNITNKNFSGLKLKPVLEFIYIRKFIQDKILKKEIVFDSLDAPASISPEVMDVYNPVNYKLVNEYLKKMKPAMNAGVPPWEAENKLVELKLKKDDKEKTSILNQPEKNNSKEILQKITEQPGITLDDIARKNEMEFNIYILILFMLGIIILILFFMFRNNK